MVENKQRALLSNLDIYLHSTRTYPVSLWSVQCTPATSIRYRHFKLCYGHDDFTVPYHTLPEGP